MPVYSVYEPLVRDIDPGQQVDKVKFVKEGFSLFAFLLPWLYFLMKRMWVAFAAYVTLIAVLMGLGYWLDLPTWMTSIVSSGVSLLIGLEARNLYQSTLESDGYKLADVVAGPKLVECEARYFENWSPQSDRGGRPETAALDDRSSAASEYARKRPSGDMIGGLEG